MRGARRFFFRGANAVAIRVEISDRHGFLPRPCWRILLARLGKKPLGPGSPGFLHVAPSAKKPRPWARNFADFQGWVSCEGFLWPCPHWAQPEQANLRKNSRRGTYATYPPWRRSLGSLWGTKTCEGCARLGAEPHTIPPTGGAVGAPHGARKRVKGAPDWARNHIR